MMLWLQKSASIQKRTSPLKFDDLAEKSEKDSISNLSPILQQNDQTLEGSFSAVSTATIATKQSFCRDFRDLQDLQSFAPLRSQNFNKTSSNFFVFLLNFPTKIAIFQHFSSNFDRILMNFYQKFAEISKNLRKFTLFCSSTRVSCRFHQKMHVFLL